MERLWLVLAAALFLWLGSGAAPGPIDAQQPPGAGRTDVLISFAAAADDDDVRDVRAFGALGVQAFTIAPVVAANVPQWAVPFLERLPGVTAVEPDYEAHTTTIASELNDTWGVQDIDAGIVHAGGNTGGGVMVAVIDTGVFCTHEDLVGSCVAGWDFVNSDADPSDDHGHGTHVAGTLSANRNGQNVVGVAPDSAILPVKVLNSSGSGSYSTIIAGIEYAVSRGADVINMSLGGSSYSAALESAVNGAYAAGAVLVASAGNAGNPWAWGDNVLYPARYTSVIAVSAVDANHDRASFSSTGAQVELSGPGVNVRSTTRDGGYADWNGTSMAAPHVSGTAALMVAAGQSNNVQVRQTMQETAEDLWTAGRDTRTGFGLVNAAAAVSGGGGAPPPPPPGNDPPAVTITAPADGASFEEGTSVTFAASATDAEDNNTTLTSGIAWSSTLDGSLGTGGSVSAVLSVGTHTVTASVTDSGGASASDSIQVTVTAAAPPPPPSGTNTLVVESVTYGTSWGGFILTVNVRIVDGTGSAVAGASVNADISNGTTTYARSGSTNTVGTVSWSIFFPAPGCYTTTVTQVLAGTPVWDGVTPPNSSC